VTDQRVLLVGMMGVGKSTVGRIVAERIGWPFVDNDDLLHADTGRYGADLLAREGVESLRGAESRALHEILRRDPPLVAGVAAGVVERSADRARIKAGGFVVWLRAQIETLVARIGDDSERAWLQPDPWTALRRLGEGRGPLYAEVSDLVIDVDDRTAKDVAWQIVASLR
jgi:shikimate kinase